MSDKFEDMVLDRHKGFSRAGLLKDKGIKHIDKGNLYYGISLIDEAKYEWFHPETIYGCFLMTNFLSIKYQELGLYDAAKWEIWSMIQYLLNNDQVQDFDILYKLFISATNIALKGGYPREYSILLNYLLSIKPKDIDIKAEEQYISNLPLILGMLFFKNRQLHNDILDVVGNRYDPVNLYKEIKLLTDAEFEESIKNDNEKTKKSARYLRNTLKNEPKLSNFILGDEPSCSKKTVWTYIIDDEEIIFEIIPENKQDEPLRFIIAALLQRFYLICDDLIRYLTPYTCTIRIKIASNLPTLNPT